jgi:hypothetical protein
MTDKPKLTEEERLAKLREWDNTPSPNPRYKGLTPAQAARAMMRPRKPLNASREE